MPLLNGLENNLALHDKYKRTGDKEAESERERETVRLKERGGHRQVRTG